MADHMDCSICLDPVNAKTTGRVEMTCKHVFHFKCLTSWFSKQDESSCPMCRQKAKELEDFAQEEKDDEEDDEEEEEEERAVYLSRFAVDAIIRQKGGPGVNAAVEAAVGFDEIGYATITRSEFDRIVCEQGCTPFSDAHWNELVFIYPVDEMGEGSNASEFLGLSRPNMEYVLRNYGGIGVTRIVDVEVDFDLLGGRDAAIPRWLLDQFLQQQGGHKLSDSQWSQLKSVYPYYPC